MVEQEGGKCTDQHARWVRGFGELLDGVEVPDFGVGFAFGGVQALLVYEMCCWSLDGGLELCCCLQQA